MATEKQAKRGDTLADFEKSLTELEALVEQLESGDISLDESLKKFERGVTLTRQCQQMLKSAELRVEQLLEDGSTAPLPDADE